MQKPENKNEKKNNAQETQVVVFRLVDQVFGIDIENAHEIIRMTNITPVPKTPFFVEGVINLRGRIIPVIDLSKRFSLDSGERNEQARIMIVEVGGTTVGLIVDAVLEVLRISTDKIDSPPEISGGIDSSYLKGIVLWEEKLITLLDVCTVLYEHRSVKSA